MATALTSRRPIWPLARRFAILALVVAPFVVRAAGSDLPSELAGKVVGVHDGDTITLLVEGRQQYKVRLEGIDAPELRQDFGTRAKQALSKAVFGKSVIVETHGRDRYGRVLGVIMLDGEPINERMVADGWAWHYVEYSDSKALAAAEKQARAKRLGLWGGNSPRPPWEWRPAQRAAADAAKDKPASKENRTARPPPKSTANADKPAASSAKFWLNTSSNVRHNSSCRYFNKTKAGRFCGPDEGTACGICGG